MLSITQFKTIFPANREAEDWLEKFDLLSDFGIESPEQIAGFCSQIGHESIDMTVLSENLNYSADALKRVFGKYFRDVDPNSYARKPEKIANRVYANRMGNGSESSGDGWKFRGRGILMITGYNNYKNCSDYLYNDFKILTESPDLVKDDKKTTMLSALWFWEVNKLKNVTDIRTLSRRVNGGDNGMDDRIRRYNRALEVL